MQLITAEDGALVARFHRGDRDAFDELVRRHQRRAYHYAFRLTRDPDEASDIVAEAFVRVYKSIGTFKGESSFSTWLHRIVTNCFLDMRKKTKNRRSISLEQIVETPERCHEAFVFGDIKDAQDLVEQTERLEAITSALQLLPERQRMILVMFHAEGMAYELIADTLRTPIGTVKSRLNRARTGLRKLLMPASDIFNLGIPGTLRYESA